MKVLKFGGTSVGSVSSMLNVKKIVEAVDDKVIVVVSALGGITDKLIKTSTMAANGDSGYEKEMKEIVEKATIKKFNVISVVFLIELIVVAVSAYPLFSIKGNIGIVIWLFLFAITLYTASKIEKFKKRYDIQTYKEILAFIDGKQLTHDETQQEIGKRNYQKIIFAFIAGVIALIRCFVVIFICSKIK